MLGECVNLLGERMMKNTLRFAALALLVSNQASLIAHTAQTFMTPQSVHGHEPAVDMTWHRTHPDSQDGIGGRVVARGFYQESTNSKALGRYFGFTNKNVITIGTVAGVDVQNSDLIQDADLGQTLAGTLELRPSRHVFGVNLGYEQALRFIHDDLFMTVNMPIIHARHSMKASVTNETTQAIGATTYGVLSYFNGSLSQAAAPKQDALHYAKFGSKNQTGIAGLEVNLGWHFVRNDDFGLRGRVLTVIPTAPSVTGEFAFEPTLGAGRNWQVGAALDGAVELYDKDEVRIDAALSLEGAYQFSNHEVRTVGINAVPLLADAALSMDQWAQYAFMGKVGTTGVFPAANVLTQSVRVTPGFRFDGNLNFNVMWKEFGFNAQYNLHAHEAESVRVRAWDDTLYAFAAATYAAAADFAIDGAMNTTALITSSNLNTRRAGNPSNLTHKVGGAFSYYPHCGHNDVVLSAGGAYEFTSNNSAPENWEVSLKAGITF